jgi:hypothetical protein
MKCTSRPGSRCLRSSSVPVCGTAYALLTKLLTNGLELIHVHLVLLLVLDLLRDALEDADGGGVVVHPARGTEGCLNDRGCRHEIVGEAVVEPALDLEQVLGGAEEGDVALGELFEGLLAVCARRVAGEDGSGGAGEGGRTGTEDSGENGC